MLYSLYFYGEIMGIIEYFKNKKKKNLPLIARVNLAEIQKQREESLQDRDVSILAAADYTKKIPTLRLFYVALEKFTQYGTDELKIGQTYGISSPFRLPHNMSMEDACKVVSYLSDKVEKENNLESACEKSVTMVSNILENYGFRKEEIKEKGHYHSVSECVPFCKIQTSVPATEEIEGVVDLFTVSGDFKIFKKTDLHDRYFDWYNEGISKQEIIDIYKRIGQEHWLPSNINSEYEKSL